MDCTGTIYRLPSIMDGIFDTGQQTFAQERNPLLHFTPPYLVNHMGREKLVLQG